MLPPEKNKSFKVKNLVTIQLHENRENVFLSGMPKRIPPKKKEYNSKIFSNY